MLTGEELTLLREVLWKRQPVLLRVVNLLGESPLTDEQRDEIRNVLADELCETGLLPNDEPNQRGIALDNIIGKVLSL